MPSVWHQLGRRAASCAHSRGEREPAQRDFPDERFGPEGDVVHAISMESCISGTGTALSGRPAPDLDPAFFRLLKEFGPGGRGRDRRRCRQAQVKQVAAGRGIGLFLSARRQPWRWWVRRRRASRQPLASARALPRSMTASKASAPVMASPLSSPKLVRTAALAAHGAVTSAELQTVISPSPLDPGFGCPRDWTARAIAEKSA